MEELSKKGEDLKSSIKNATLKSIETTNEEAETMTESCKISLESL